MLYREAGQFKATYAEDSQIFPIRQDRIGIALILAAAFVGIPLLSVAGILADYTFTATRMDDGAMLASKAIVIRGSTSASLCTLGGSGGSGPP